MKITVEIPDAHAGDLFQFLASLSAKPMEPSTDPAPGHPELPLESPAVVMPPMKNPSGADPLLVATDDPVEPAAPEDPTMRVVEIPAEMHPLPDLPEGYSRWVGRGCGWPEAIAAGNRVVRWFRWSTNEWQPTSTFSAHTCFHIEAVKDAPAAEQPAEPVDKPRLIPEPGNYYYLRSGRQARIDCIEGRNAIKGAVLFSGKWSDFYWRSDGTPYGSDGPEWECVEIAPF